MRIFDIKLEFNPVLLAAGFGVALLAPPVIAAAPKILRSAAKAIIKAALITSNRMKLVYWEEEPGIMVGGSGAVSTAETEQGKVETEGNELVYVSGRGRKYHRANCSFAANAKISIPLLEARTKGYVPCKLCNV